MGGHSIFLTWDRKRDNTAVHVDYVYTFHSPQLETFTIGDSRSRLCWLQKRNISIEEEDSFNAFFIGGHSIFSRPIWLCTQYLSFLYFRTLAKKKKSLACLQSQNKEVSTLFISTNRLCEAATRMLCSNIFFRQYVNRSAHHPF